jgi:Uma2 family endonuclease
MSTAHPELTMFPESDYEDGVYYPSSDGKPMAETGIHVHALLMLYQLLLEYFADRSDVLVTANQFWYWEKGNPKARRAPDVMIVPGVPREPLRRSYRMWLEGNTLPAAIFEMSSKKTIKNDTGVKYQQYQQLGVREYFLCDPDHRVLDPALQGFRLVNGQYDKIPWVGDTIESELGFRVRIEEKILRLTDVRTGRPVLFPAEQAQVARERANELSAEVERLRRLLQERNGNGA